MFETPTLGLSRRPSDDASKITAGRKWDLLRFSQHLTQNGCWNVIPAPALGLGAMSCFLL